LKKKKFDYQSEFFTLRDVCYLKSDRINNYIKYRRKYGLKYIYYNSNLLKHLCLNNKFDSCIKNVNSKIKNNVLKINFIKFLNTLSNFNLKFLSSRLVLKIAFYLLDRINYISNNNITFFCFFNKH